MAHIKIIITPLPPHPPSNHFFFFSEKLVICQFHIIKDKSEFSFIRLITFVCILDATMSPHFRAIDEVWEYQRLQFALRVSRDDLLHPTHDTQLSADFLTDLGNVFVEREFIVDINSK